MMMLVLALYVAASGASGPAAERVPTLEPAHVQRLLWASRDLFDTNVHAIVRCRPEGATAPRFRLAYLPCRNRCEVPRLLLEEAGCAYDFEVVGFSAWRASVKARTPHGKLPVLWDYDGAGACLSQEQTITRFLAQRVGLAGRSILEQAEVDMWYAQLFCTLRNNGVSHDGEHYSDVYRREAAQLSAAERSLSALRVFEERLEQSGSGFLVGGRITYADLALFDILFELAEPDNVPGFAAAFALPQLGAFLERIEARPKIAEYLRSARRMPRYGRNAQTGEGVYEYVPGRHAPPPSDLPAGYRYGAS